MGTVVRDWRLANRARRAAASTRLRSAASTARQLGYELRSAPAPATSRHPVLARAATVLVPLLLLVAWVWWLGSERRAVRAMPPAERVAVYEETMRGFEDLCTPPRAGLESHCRRQAAFLLNFPECTQHCQSLTRPVLQWRS